MMLKVRLRRDRILLILARRNYSQNGLARSLGISSGYMSQLMKGVRRPSPRLRRKMLGVLQMKDFDELFEIEEVSVAAL